MCKYGWRKGREGIYLDVNIASSPPPIRRAYTLRAPAKTLQVEQVEAGTLLGHNVVAQQIKEEGSDTDWRDRITSPKAIGKCSKTGRKTLYAPCEEELKDCVQKWLEVCECDE